MRLSCLPLALQAKVLHFKTDALKSKLTLALQSSDDLVQARSNFKLKVNFNVVVAREGSPALSNLTALRLTQHQKWLFLQTQKPPHNSPTLMD